MLEIHNCKTKNNNCKNTTEKLDYFTVKDSRLVKFQSNSIKNNKIKSFNNIIKYNVEIISVSDRYLYDNVNGVELKDKISYISSFVKNKNYDLKINQISIIEEQNITRFNCDLYCIEIYLFDSSDSLKVLFNSKLNAKVFYNNLSISVTDNLTKNSRIFKVIKLLK